MYSYILSFALNDLAPVDSALSHDIVKSGVAAYRLVVK